MLYLRYCIFGSKAWVEAKDFHHPSEVGPTYFSVCRQEGEVISSTYDWEDTVRLNFDAFAEACLGHQPYPFSNEEKIRIIGINYKDSKKSAINWLNKLGNPYSNIPIDKDGRVAIEWGVYGIPETFVINSKGIIKYKHIGPITENVYKKINLLIKKIE